MFCSRGLFPRGWFKGVVSLGLVPSGWFPGVVSQELAPKGFSPRVGPQGLAPTGWPPTGWPPTAHWCDSQIIGENLEFLLLNVSLWRNFFCCVFCNKKLAEIYAMEKNSLKCRSKVFSSIILKNFQGFFSDENQRVSDQCDITTELGSAQS